MSPAYWILDRAVRMVRGQNTHAVWRALIVVALLAAPALADEVAGTGVGDELHGGRGADTLIGLSGDDLLHGGRGADTLLGGMGADTLRAGRPGARYGEQLFGGPGADRLVVRRGDPAYLEGGPGPDTCIGRPTDDYRSCEVIRYTA